VRVDCEGRVPRQCTPSPLFGPMIALERVAPSIKRKTASASPPSAWSLQVEAVENPVSYNGAYIYGFEGCISSLTIAIPLLHLAIERLPRGDCPNSREMSGLCSCGEDSLKISVRRSGGGNRSQGRAHNEESTVHDEIKQSEFAKE